MITLSVFQKHQCYEDNFHIQLQDQICNSFIARTYWGIKYFTE